MLNSDLARRRLEYGTIDDEVGRTVHFFMRCDAETRLEPPKEYLSHAYRLKGPGLDVYCLLGATLILESASTGATQLI